MAEILFVTWDGGGNVPPATARRRRARVARPRRTVRRPPAPAGVARGRRPRGRAVRVRRAAFSALDTNSPLALVAMFGDRGLGRDVLAALADRPADVVVVDCLLFGVMAELTRAGRPYVVLEHLYDAYLTGAG